ncbi:integrase core domain-containing protein [Glycomyces xiaoerkulensis]|uniref:integrase core domain-containing protein n=1 Tax=Glycomyces xiaoerkulensis TaxID=2038139 RepID=UPI0038CC0481
MRTRTTAASTPRSCSDSTASGTASCNPRGKVGTSADNALAESFHASLKRELLGTGGRFTDADTARLEVFSYLNWFNHRRRHSSLGYDSPVEYEQRLATVPTTV